MFYPATKKEEFFPVQRHQSGRDITPAVFSLTLNPNLSLSLQSSEIIQLTVIQCLLWTAAS